MAKWHPIETAPKTAYILLAYRYQFGPRVSQGSYSEGRNAWLTYEGTLVAHTDDLLGWMPLPEAPQEKVRQS